MSDEMHNVERHEFQSEAKQILELMIHSVYSNPDIFLRELISNASDAIDKLRIESLSDENLAGQAGDGRITVAVDREAKTVTVSDNGIGMSHDELISYLGTIARSGTKEFLRAMREAASGQGDLIGQFGVGFYSSFIVAHRVTVDSMKAGTGESWVWDSTGDGSFTIGSGARETSGTDVTLYMREAEHDDAEAHKDYLSVWTLREIVKQYSDFVSYPIYLREEGNEEADETPVNSMKALWIRAENEVTEEEYHDFYRHLTHDWQDPLERIVYRGEGTNEFHALLYVPAHPPMDLFYRDGAHGIQLYIRRVFIMNDCRELIPEYLRFVKGVVDSEDLSLNVSREILQQDVHTAMIKRSLTRKLLDSFRRMKEDRPDDYRKFWDMFGVVLKEGIVSDARNREQVMKLALFDSSRGGKRTLEEYVASLREGQKSVYYLAGGTPEALAASPKLEAFEKRGIEVLLLGDPVDEIWTGAAGAFEEHPFVSISVADIEIEGEDAIDEEEREAAKKVEETGLVSKLKEALVRLGDAAKSVEDVKVSSRLVDSPATFVLKGAPVSPQMRNFFRAMGQEMPEEKRVLELNPSHPLIRKIAVEAERAAGAEDAAEKFDGWATILIGLASIGDGEPLENGRDFTKILTRLLEL